MKYCVVLLHARRGSNAVSTSLCAIDDFKVVAVFVQHYLEVDGKVAITKAEAAPFIVHCAVGRSAAHDRVDAIACMAYRSSS